MVEKYSCPVFQAADIIGKKWAIVLLQEIDLYGDKGFVFIQKRMKKISPKILAARIAQLETFEIIQKEIIEKDRRKGVEYSFTKKGKDLYKVVLKLRDWKTKYAADNEECRSKECVSCKLF
jgi:DNA-binding HxlR family transcriptional regulator